MLPPHAPTRAQIEHARYRYTNMLWGQSIIGLGLVAYLLYLIHTNKTSWLMLIALSITLYFVIDTAITLHKFKYVEPYYMFKAVVYCNTIGSVAKEYINIVINQRRLITKEEYKIIRTYFESHQEESLSDLFDMLLESGGDTFTAIEMYQHHQSVKRTTE